MLIPLKTLFSFGIGFIKIDNLGHHHHHHLYFIINRLFPLVLTISQLGVYLISIHIYYTKRCICVPLVHTANNLVIGVLTKTTRTDASITQRYRRTLQISLWNSRNDVLSKQLRSTSTRGSQGVF